VGVFIEFLQVVAEAAVDFDELALVVEILMVDKSAISHPRLC
jgi:hypothetical protein